MQVYISAELNSGFIIWKGKYILFYYAVMPSVSSEKCCVVVILFSIIVLSAAYTPHFY